MEIDIPDSSRHPRGSGLLTLRQVVGATSRGVRAYFWAKGVKCIVDGGCVQIPEASRRQCTKVDQVLSREQGWV